MHNIIIIGTGFGGISAAIKLNQRGIHDFIMLERRSFFGGTWMQNRYPGAAVDVPSPLYSVEGEPYPWTRLFAKRNELEAYTAHLVEKHQLNEKIKLNAEVKQAKWMDDHWQLTLKDGQVLQARTVINATGPLSTPVVPEFEGKDDFEGQSFHCNDWPDNLDLQDKKVAIIGSGASAIQIIPAIVEKVKKLHVFQRTPHWVIPRFDPKFPKWIQKLLSVKWLYGLIKRAIYVHYEVRVLAFKYSKFLLTVVGQGPANRLLKKQVPDEAFRKTLTPDFVIGCKRILISNTYFPALQKDNVSFHDKSSGIKRITKTGIVTSKDESLDVDVIVYATGYDAADSLISYEVRGRHNIALADQWSEYPRAYLGTSVPNFPNFFVVTGPNTGIGHTSAIYVIESQMRYIMQCVEKLQTPGVNSIEPTEYAEEQYTQMIHKEMERTVWHYGGCQSWYQNKSGKVIAMFPGFTFVFRHKCRNFKQDAHLIS
ncbi:NAD(P)/FAD-dependent oxidoreductase [Glaciecola sp. XM2]|uniref:flavin-containing monooxygenase n=1 Tax=Glaciecola sp. XM2 TaxID=1914931 RepID=UPI001BDEF839|nr:NAD(P)/FAD-dependent oxidoreductase [Glaciecola sp. XM2]MBT1449650.1 NAD(P)/FAD-dependent oxidoreductase [Glaciecola sp. XM2]